MLTNYFELNIIIFEILIKRGINQMTINPLTQSNTNITTSAVYLNAQNPEALATFYIERIGLKRLNEDSADKWISLGVSSGEELIRIYSTETPKEERTTGLYHLALMLPTRSDLGNIIKHMVTTQTPITGASNHGYSEALYLDDIEGNGIEIYVDKAKSEWEYNEDGTIPGIVEPMDVEGVLSTATQDNYQGMPTGTVMGHVHLHVADLNDTLEFYHELLGLGAKFLMGESALFMATGEEHHHLGANLWKGSNIPAAAEDTQGLRSVIWSANEEDFNTIIERLNEAKHPFIEDDQFITLKDPAGIQTVIQKA